MAASFAETDGNQQAQTLCDEVLLRRVQRNRISDALQSLGSSCGKLAW
jgi:hypothetical protein